MANKRVLLDFGAGNEGPVATEFDTNSEIVIDLPEGEESAVEKVPADTPVDPEPSGDSDLEEIDDDDVENIDEEDDEESDMSEGDDLEDTDVDDTSYQAFGDAIKSVGLLPSDLELPEDVTGGVIVEKVRDHLVPKFKEQALGEVQNWLINEGITQQGLLKLKALQTGAPDKLITDLSTYHTVGVISDSDIAEMDEERKEELVRFMYNDQKIDKIAVDATIKTYRDDIDPLVKKAVEYSAAKYKSLEQAEVARQQEVDRIRLEQENYRNNFIQGVFTNSKLGDYDLDDADLILIRDSLFNRNRQLNINGQRQVVSSYEEFRHRINNDVEFQLQVFYENVNKEKLLSKVKKETATSVEVDFLKKIPSKVISKKRVSSKKVKKKVEKPSTNFNSYKEEEINNRY